jgi:hypothetical protein
MSESEIAPGRRGWNRYHLLVAAVAVTLLALAGFVAAGDGAAVNRLLNEGGVVESLSAAGYLICLALIATLGGFGFLLRRYEVAVTLLFLAARELDFHKRFWTTGIFKSEFYLSSDVPLVEKLIAGPITLFLCWAAARLVFDHWRQFAETLLRLHPAAVSFFIGAGSLVAAKTFDGVQRKLVGFGVAISDETSHVFRNMEEVLELSAPAFFIVAAIAYFGLKRPQAMRA